MRSEKRNRGRRAVEEYGVGRRQRAELHTQYGDRDEREAAEPTNEREEAARGVGTGSDERRMDAKKAELGETRSYWLSFSCGSLKESATLTGRPKPGSTGKLCLRPRKRKAGAQAFCSDRALPSRA